MNTLAIVAVIAIVLVGLALVFLRKKPEAPVVLPPVTGDPHETPDNPTYDDGEQR